MKHSKEELDRYLFVNQYVKSGRQNGCNIFEATTTPAGTATPSHSAFANDLDALNQSS